MVRVFSIILLVLAIGLNANALSMQDLFKALKKQPVTTVDKLVLKESIYAQKGAVSQFYPKIYGLSSYEQFNSPTSLRPVTPTESARITKTNGAFPFSKAISQLGIEVDMPVFVYPLFSLAKKAQAMRKSAEEKLKLNILRNEAVLVSLNAKLQYLEKLKKAMIQRKKSLQTQLENIKIGVKTGRTPEIEALKIENMINQIDIEINNIETSKNSVIAGIKTLTSINIKHSIPMYQTRNLKEGEFFTTKPLQYVIKAKKYAVDAQKARLYPSFYLKGFAFRKFGTSYNTDDSVIRNYANIGLYMQIPIFNKTIYTDIQKTKSDYIKSKFELSQLNIELKSDSESLNSQLKILKNSIVMAQKSVQNQKQLLKYAKVAFDTQRMTEEEYLRYEDELLSAQANLLSLKTKKWEIVSKLAVIYGNDLEEIVK